MARTAITPTALPGAAGINAPAGTTVDPTNGHVFTPARGKLHRCVIWVHNTAVSTKVCTVKAGANPPAQGAPKGDLAVTCQASGDTYIGPLSSSQFIQADGSVNVDLAAAITGTIAVLEMPEV